MTVFWWSNQCFNVAAVVYAVAFFLYAGQLASNRKLFSSASSWVARAAWGLHTTALALRWVHAGIGHPPWTNLYESLVFFSWGVMGVHLYLEARFDFKLSGIFASAVVFVAMGIATLHPNKEIEPLVPALQSWWLLFHVFMACIAYAFFLSASFFSVFYLLRDKVKLETMAACAALVCVLFLAIAAGKTFFTTGQIQFFKVVQMEGKEIIVNFKGADGKLVQQFVSVPGAQYLLWSMLGLYLGSAGLLLRGGMGSRGAGLARWGKYGLAAALVLHVALLADVVAAPSFVSDMALKSNPYRLAGIIMTLGIAAFFAGLFRFKDRILKLLPSGETLDRWNYQAILLGVPFMTLNLVSGAVWAYYAWGRYWGWDPKETWALVTWLIYVLYLHMRLLGGWKGRKTALISILGFFVVIFTYLGVNLVISGLHSYATG